MVLFLYNRSAVDRCFIRKDQKCPRIKIYFINIYNILLSRTRSVYNSSRKDHAGVEFLFPDENDQGEWASPIPLGNGRILRIIMLRKRTGGDVTKWSRALVERFSTTRRKDVVSIVAAGLWWMDGRRIPDVLRVAQPLDSWEVEFASLSPSLSPS